MLFKIVSRSLTLALLAALLTAGAPSVITFHGNLDNSPVVAAMVESQIAAGDGFLQNGQFGSAVQAYEVAATLDRAIGELPVEATRRVANARFYQGDYERAAEVLADLADEAAAAGAPEAEFWASLDAANMDRLVGDNEGLERWLTRAQLLLDSSAFSDLQREEVIHAATNGDFKVFAPHLASW